jgi:hypothetical protein
VLEKIGAQLVQYYIRNPGEQGFQPTALRTAMGERLKEFVPQLAPDYRRCFPL